MPKKIQLKTNKSTVKVKDFLATITDEQKRQDSETIVQMIEEITGKPATMWGKSIVGFDDYVYTRSNGDEGDWFRIGFSPRKQNLTIYIMSGYKDFGPILEKLGPHKLGKCCLYIKKLSDIHLPTLKKIIKKGYDDFK